MNNLYPRAPRENERFRVKLLKKAENDPAFQKSLIEECEKDPLFFFNNFLWTFNPRLAEAGFSGDLPFITYGYQDDFINDTVDSIKTGIDQWTEKSRDMGYSWCLVGIMLWGFLFPKWSSLYGSYKQDYVDQVGNMDSHFERLRYCIARLPSWILPNDLESKYMNISSEETGAAISGDAGENFGTGGRRKFVVLDEFALWQHDAKAFRKTRDLSSCRLFGGTPEGKFNIYGKVMTKHEDFKHLKIKRLSLHWTLHPAKSAGVKVEGTHDFITSKEAFAFWKDGIRVTSPWYRNEQANRTPLDLAKEVDISYSGSVTGRVYPAFEKKIHVGRFEYTLSKEIITSVSWDFGLDMTSFEVWQKNMRTGRNRMIKAFQRSNKEIQWFAAFFTGEPTSGEVYHDDPEALALIEEMRGWKIHHHFGDPYNKDNRSVVTKSTIVKVLAKYGIHVKYPVWETYKKGKIVLSPTTLEDRIRKVTLRLHTVDVDDRELEFMEMMQQSRYPKQKEDNEATSERTKPVHDQSSHLRTATEYYFDNEPMPLRKRKSTRDLEKEFEKYG